MIAAVRITVAVNISHRVGKVPVVRLIPLLPNDQNKKSTTTTAAAAAAAAVPSASATATARLQKTKM